MQDFEKGKLESFKQEHAVLKQKQLHLLKEVTAVKVKGTMFKAPPAYWFPILLFFNFHLVRITITWL